MAGILCSVSFTALGQFLEENGTNLAEHHMVGEGIHDRMTGEAYSSPALGRPEEGRMV